MNVVLGIIALVTVGAAVVAMSGRNLLHSVLLLAASWAGVPGQDHPPVRWLCGLAHWSTAAAADTPMVGEEAVAGDDSARAGRRTMADISATITDQMPLTAESGLPPHCASAKKLVSRRGSTSMDMARLTRITTSRGSMATRMLESCSQRWP